MDPSCECECDCEAWASRVAYEYTQTHPGLPEYTIERMLCENCYTKGCRLWWPETHSNPWKNVYLGLMGITRTPNGDSTSKRQSGE